MSKPARAVFKATSVFSSPHTCLHVPFHPLQKPRDTKPHNKTRQPRRRRDKKHSPRAMLPVHRDSHNLSSEVSSPQAGEPSDSSVSHTQAKLLLLQQERRGMWPWIELPSPGQNKPRTLRYTRARPWAVNAGLALSLFGW